ncbi:MAG: choice-of-anchor J domain-containing protein [Bacteroidales bacterium]|nr:choice-of-anchor J domain-containing protein [Bacteroidales bacterium]
MKRTVYSLAILAIAGIAVLSCSKEPKIEDTIKAPQGITVKVVSAEGTTKTHIVDGDVPTVEWSADDKIYLFEAVDGEVKGKAESESAVISDGLAGFSTTIDWAAEGSSYQYSAVYPSNSIISYSGNYYIIIPEEQVLNGNNFSVDSDVLFSTPLDHGASRVADGEELMFSFRRLGTVVRLNIIGIAEGETISEIKVVAPCNIAGAIVYDPVTSTVDPSSAFEAYGSNTVSLYPEDIVATGNDVFWFRVMAESDWAVGDKFSVQVSTDQNVYKKEVTLPSVIKFPDGGLTKFGVNLASSVVPPMAVPCTWDFEDGADDWTFIDNDGDGFNWELFDTDGGNPHSGTTYLTSASFINDLGALEPDNWAFTPRVQLTEGNYLSFWVRAQDPSWQDEHYAVYITKGSPMGEMSILIPETIFPQGSFVEIGDDGYYQHHIVQIPEEFDNEVVCIGFRHFNCTDMYMLDIDDVSITEEYPYQAPEADYADFLGQWTTGSRVFTIEQKVEGESYTISGFTGQEYPVEAKFEGNILVVYDQIVNTSGSTEIAIQGIPDLYLPDYPSEEIILFRAVYDEEENALIIQTANEYYIWIIYENKEFYDYILYSAIPEKLVPYVPGPDVEDPNTYLFKDDFENGLGNWTLFDADGDGYNWQWYAYEDYAHSGESFLWGYSYSSPNSYDPDNYAFTKGITLTTNNYLSFWVRGITPYYPDHYGVFISSTAPTANNLANCVKLFEGDADNTTYEKIEISIPSEYDGQTVYIAFRHFDSYDMYYVFIDDVAVTEGQLIEPSSSAAPAYLARPKQAAVTVKGNLKKVSDSRGSTRNRIPVKTDFTTTRR